jgi:hypothetical protein
MKRLLFSRVIAIAVVLIVSSIGAASAQSNRADVHGGQSIWQFSTAEPIWQIFKPGTAHSVR